MGTTTRKQAQAAPQEQAAPLTLEDVRARHPDMDIWAASRGSALYARPRLEGPWPLIGETPAELDAAISAVKEQMQSGQPDAPAADPGP